jgi:hypothetical protein
MKSGVGLFFLLVTFVFTVGSHAEQTLAPDQVAEIEQSSAGPRVIEQAEIMAPRSKIFGTRRYDTHHSETQHYCSLITQRAYQSGRPQSYYYSGYDRNHRRWASPIAVRVGYRQGRGGHHSQFDNYYYPDSYYRGSDTVWYIGPDARRRHRVYALGHRSHRSDRRHR